MLQIRGEQRNELDNDALKNFEDRMVIHLRKFFKPQCDKMTEEEIRKAIQYGLTRAKTYGILTERDVCKYIDLMFGFGRDYDKDPKYPWAARTLTDKANPDPTVRINLAYDAAMASVKP